MGDSTAGAGVRGGSGGTIKLPSCSPVQLGRDSLK